MAKLTGEEFKAKMAAKKGEKIVKPGKTKKAKEKAPKVEKPSKEKRPKGFSEAKEKGGEVANAYKSLRSRFPGMTMEECATYLIFVGAGRYMALATYAASKW